MDRLQRGFLELEDGSVFEGTMFGGAGGSDGEVVFNTGMVGYPESMTDPSYRGQVLAFTYPLIGNYGVPSPGTERFESDRIQVRGLVVNRIMGDRSHHEAAMSLSDWMVQENIPGISGVDTRELTKRLRSCGTMLGRILPAGQGGSAFEVMDPNRTDLVSQVSSRDGYQIGSDNPGPRVVLIDCGCKNGIIRELLARDCRVRVVPYDADPSNFDHDGVMISNGPGDPAVLKGTIGNVKRLLEGERPVAGICLGCQLMALAAGARTYKLRFGHRSQNQPCREEGSGRCYITSQNHGFAIEEGSLPGGWRTWYRNLNDGTVEGIRHEELPFFALQFHPEARPGPTDSRGFFDLFVEAL